MEIPTQLKNLKFCRIKKRTKKPFEKDWTNKPYTYEEISKFQNENYGVLCGYENLAVIDCDVPALSLAIESLLPKTFQITTGSGGKHFYYFIPNLKQKLILETDNKEHLGEVQSYGAQVVGAGSLHPNGKKYVVSNSTEIKKIDCDALYSVLAPFMKEVKESENLVNLERNLSQNSIDDLSVADIWGTIGMKSNKKGEYYGCHPIHGSQGGMNFWINSLKNCWHCFRCGTGGGALSAIAVKEGIIDCSQARAGSLRGSPAIEAIKVAKEKYGLKDEGIISKILSPPPERELNLIWEYELEDYKDDDVEWIIDKIIPNKAVCILTGKRGTLKTFVALNIAYAIASGTKFLDKFSTGKAGVLYFDKENGVHIMKQRVKMIKRGLELEEKLKIGFICFSQLKIDKKFDLLAIEKVIEEHKPKLLIVDTYRRGISFDENDAGAVSKLFVDMLRPLCEEHNFSILLIHHNRKGGANTNDEMDELRGSSDLANYADIILKTERRSSFLILKQLKNRNMQELKPIQIKTNFEHENLKLEYVGEFQKVTKTDKAVDNLIVWLYEKGIEQFTTKQAKEVAFKKGIKESTFKYALNQLLDAGIIESLQFGVYKVNREKLT
jgi:RecA-family ATPase